jgi:hypothetical protein
VLEGGLVKAHHPLTTLLLGLGLLGAPLYACSDDHDHDHDGDEKFPPSCEAFHEACVKVMQSRPKAKECDDFIHAAGRTEAECATKKDECVAACKP